MSSRRFFLDTNIVLTLVIQPIVALYRAEIEKAFRA